MSWSFTSWTEMSWSFLLRSRLSFMDLEEDLKLLTDPHAVRSAYLEDDAFPDRRLSEILRFIPD